MNTLLLLSLIFSLTTLYLDFLNLFFRVLSWIPWPLMFLSLYMCHSVPELALHAVKMLLLSDST